MTQSTPSARLRRRGAKPHHALVLHFCIVCAALVLLVAAWFGGVSARTLAIWGSAVWTALIVLIYRARITSVFVLFSIPWVLILLSTTAFISSYSRPIDTMTVATVLACAIAVLALTPAQARDSALAPQALAAELRHLRMPAFTLFGWILSALTILNVVIAGFIPVLSLASTGDSRYQEFGLPGLYGFYNAFANAYGVLAFYLFLMTRRRVFLAVVSLCLLIFAAFFSRQNAVSLVFECFMLQCVVVKLPSLRRIGSFVVVVLMLFSAAGDARIGEQSIYELASIDEADQWLPKPVVWLYSYSYFNILNLDNLIAGGYAPTWSGSSVQSLVPSFLRPATELSFETIEARQFNVTSFIDPIYRDVGVMGLLVIFSLLCIATQRFWRQASGREARFGALASYCVLTFCFCFSFFVNFWFYLPVIAQLLFFKLFTATVFRPLPRSIR